MAPELEKIQQQALLLSPADRETLAERLVRSLGGEPANEVDEAWIQEAERRYQDHKSGKTPGIPADRVFTEIRQELKWQS